MRKGVFSDAGRAHRNASDDYIIGLRQENFSQLFHGFSLFCPRPNIGRAGFPTPARSRRPSLSGHDWPASGFASCAATAFAAAHGPGWIFAGGAVIPSDARSRPACSNWLRRTGGVAAQARAGLGVGGDHGERDLPALDVQVGHRPRRVGEASDAAVSATVRRCRRSQRRRRPCFHGDRSRWRSPTEFADRARLVPAMKNSGWRRLRVAAGRLSVPAGRRAGKAVRMEGAGEFGKTGPTVW
jgi:hypothetical protein